MATMLYNGSAGEDVKKLQKALLDRGYDLGSYGADGIFGAKTESAVRQYQKDMGLAVDGIAGEKTLGSLYAASKPAQTPATQTQTTQSQSAQVPVITQTPATKAPQTSQTATQIQSAPQVPTVQTTPQTTQQTAPEKEKLPQGEMPVYQPSYEGLLNSLQEQLTQGQNFSYRLEDDPLYHQYRQAYLREGDLAARDSAARAAAATGGYGNSYAQTVSQQTLQGYLDKLYALTPELAKTAYDRHQGQQDLLLQQYKLAQAAQDAEYGRYQDALKQYLNAQQEAYDRQQDALKLARQEQLDVYEKEQDALKLELQAQQEAYDRAQDQYKTLQNLIKAGYEATDAELLAVGMTRAQADALLPKSTTKSASSSSGGSYNNGGYTEEQIKQLQTFLGVTADGKFGSQSKAAMKEKGYSSLDKAMQALQSRQGYFTYDDAAHSQLNEQNNGQSMYSMVVKKLKQMHASKEPLSKVADYLGQMVGDSYITRSEYLQLYNNYRDHRL